MTFALRFCSEGTFPKKYTFLESPAGSDLRGGSYIENVGIKNAKCHKVFFILFLIGVPAGLIIALIFRDSLARLAQAFPPCPFYRDYCICCPSCGNSRSVLSLLQGDVLSSLRYNITPPFLLAIILAFYGEAIARLFGKKITLVPRQTSFLVVVIVGFIVYFVARNFIPGIKL